MSTRRGASSARASTLSNKTVSKNAMSRTNVRLISGPSTRSSARTRVRSSQWKLNNRVRQAVDSCRVPQPEADQSFIESGSMGWHMQRRINPFCAFSICCSDNQQQLCNPQAIGKNTIQQKTQSFGPDVARLDRQFHLPCRSHRQVWRPSRLLQTATSSIHR